MSRLKKWFDPEAPFWRGQALLADGLMLGLLFLVCSLPILTFGASLTAFYDAVYRSARQDERRAVARFCTIFRMHWKAAAFPGLLFLLLSAAIFHTRQYFILRLNAGQTNGRIAGAALFFFLLFINGILCWFFPILSRFQLSTRQALKNSAVLAFRFWPVTFLLCAGLYLACAGMVLSFLWIFPLFLLPALLMFFWSLLLEPFFLQLADQREPKGILAVFREAYFPGKESREKEE